MRFTSALFSLAALLGAAVDARSATGDRILVVRDEKYSSGYNKFFESLKDRGYTLTLTKPGDEGNLLEAYDTPLYDHLIVFAPEAKKFHNNFAARQILDAQSTYLNTLYVLSPELDATQVTLLREYDIEPSPGGVLYDAFSHVGGGSEADVVLPADSLIAPTPILGNLDSKAGPVVFGRGTGFSTGLNPFLVDIASAPDSAYLGDKEAQPLSKVKPGFVVQQAGRSVSVAAAMQTRENVRIGFVGSTELFNDKWWGKKLDGVETGNRMFLEDLSKWLFQETGVLRVERTHHYREGETEPRDEYTKKDLVNYEITISEHVTLDDKTSAWVPAASISDMQLEFTMLDPHYRIPLPPAPAGSAPGTYSASFIAPDRHGVFKFVVNYFRPGFSHLQVADKASVVPLRHDEHPRFIVGAYPFYAGALSTSAAFLFFVVLWIRLGESDKRTKTAKTE